MKLKRAGFTMIEMLVGIALTTAMSGIMLANFGNYSRQRGQEAALMRLEQVFVEAKTNALSGKMDCGASACGGADGTCNGVNDKFLDGWTVEITGGANGGYEIYGVCGGTEFMNRTESFPNMTISDTGGGIGHKVIFYPLNGGTSINGNKTVKVQGSDGVTISFILTKTGEIIH